MSDDKPQTTLLLAIILLLSLPAYAEVDAPCQYNVGGKNCISINQSPDHVSITGTQFDGIDLPDKSGYYCLAGNNNKFRPATKAEYDKHDMAEICIEYTRLK